MIYFETYWIFFFVKLVGTPRLGNLKTQLYFHANIIRHENGAFRKRSSNRKNLKTPALRLSVDGKHLEIGAFQKR